jgi:hypothetical protein
MRGSGGWGLVVALVATLAAPACGLAADARKPEPPTPQEPAAEPAKSGSFLGLKMPAMPNLTKPEMPSLPDLVKSVGALPERVGLPNANQVIDQQFDRMVQKLNRAIPAIESLGYEVRNFEVDWTLPPIIKVRLQSSEVVTHAEFDYVLKSVKGDLILESIIMSLAGVHRMQSATNLSAFKRALIEVDVAVPPHVIMVFSDPTNKFRERFEEHRRVMHEAMAREQNKPQ